MKRCFIALNLPVEIKTEFKRIQDILKEKNKSTRITWVKPDVAHLNLHFLGDLDDNKINQLKNNLKLLEGKFGFISLALTGVGAFPNLKDPRILFLGVKHQGENNLIKLYQEIGKMLNSQNLRVENRPFIAHLTLGRIKDTSFKQQINLIGEEMKDIEFKINFFDLMESVLKPDGPEYKIIQSYSL